MLLLSFFLFLHSLFILSKSFSIFFFRSSFLSLFHAPDISHTTRTSPCLFGLPCVCSPTNFYSIFNHVMCGFFPVVTTTTAITLLTRPTRAVLLYPIPRIPLYVKNCTSLDVLLDISPLHTTKVFDLLGSNVPSSSIVSGYKKKTYNPNLLPILLSTYILFFSCFSCFFLVFFFSHCAKDLRAESKSLMYVVKSTQQFLYLKTN